MANRQLSIEKIVSTISDYRAGEIQAPDAAHVERWISQFDLPVQDDILSETAHVLGNTYINKLEVEGFINKLLTSNKLSGQNPCQFWAGVKFLSIQVQGNSQRDMMAIVDAQLKALCGYSVSSCGHGSSEFIYVDDALFTGGRIRSDLIGWIRNSAPKSSKIHIVTMALHQGGQFYTQNKLMEAANSSGKTIEIKWWCGSAVEDRRSETYNSDVMRPTVIPADPATQTYVQGLGYPPVLRMPGGAGSVKFFSSEAGRHLLEQEFLKAGVRIRAMCPHLNPYMRPLGNSVLATTGFGTTIVTFRNCPNNAPLVFWAGNPWHPLFARKTN